MDEQDKELLERYLKDIRKRNKKIALLIIFIFFVASTSLYVVYDKYKKTINDIDNSAQIQIETNIIDTNNTNDKDNDGNTDEETNEGNEVDELPKENENIATKEESRSQETKEEYKQNTSVMKIQNEEKSKNTKAKPSNKDFLFTNGYNMDNVTQAAQEYLKSYNYSGECIPIKDSEGVYLGMRVIFY